MIVVNWSLSNGGPGAVNAAPGMEKLLLGTIKPLSPVYITLPPESSDDT